LSLRGFLLLLNGRNVHQRKKVQDDSDAQKQSSDAHESNERKRMVPKQAERLDNQANHNKNSGQAQPGMNRVDLIFHHCTGFQYFTWSRSFTLWMESWHPDDMQESLLLLMSAIV